MHGMCRLKWSQYHLDFTAQEMFKGIHRIQSTIGPCCLHQLDWNMNPIVCVG